MLWGDNGIITKATKAAFYTEMEALNEQKDLTKVSYFMTNGISETDQKEFLDSKVSSEDVKNFSKTLKAEIALSRGGLKKEKAIKTEDVWDKNYRNCQEMYDDSAVTRLANDLYYVNEEILNGEKKYIYDETSDICFKITDTGIGSYTVHSLEYAKLVLDGIESGAGEIKMTVEAMQSSDGSICYEPDFNNFSYSTDIIYYSPDFSTTSTMPIKEYIKNGKPKIQSVEGVIYTFADYSATKKVQGNAKCIASGIESNWVWIPRYAYKLGNQTAEAIFVDMNNKPMDTGKYGDSLPEGYVVHSAFTQKGENLKGIWFSKYAASPENIKTEENKGASMPNLDKFKAEDTKLIYYTEDGKESIEESYSTNPEITIEKGGKTYYFYNYDKRIWANVKCTSNGIESQWVWIPRYAYKLGTEASTTAILVDMDNKPIDISTFGNALPEGYVVHSAFTQKGENLKGIWFSKYAASSINIETNENKEATMPNLSKFESASTKLIYYTEDGQESIEENFSTNPAISIKKDNKTYYFYNYDKRIFANVKCTANNITSYWVWIPRYAYRLGTETTTTAILVDMNNKPIATNLYGDSLPEGYVVHSAFTQKGENLKGIWFSKYAASSQEVSE